MAHMRAGQLDEAEEEFDLALLNLPDDVTDESPRARLFLELARLARKRGDAEGAQSYYRASYLLSRPMLRHALRPPLPITGEAKEAQANMGTCPVAVVPFKTRSFSARAAAVEFEAQASTSVERFCDGCSEMAPLDEKLADGGSSFDSFVSSHRDSARKVSSADGQIEVKPDLPHALAILAAGGGFTLLDLRMHADGCGNGSCGRGQAVLDGGVWRVTIARDEVPFDYPVCDCVEDSDSWWRSCTGCHGECQCPPYPVTTPSPFGPREAFYIDARSGEPLWHTLEDQNDKYVAPQIDGTGLHVTAVGCPASWPAPKRLADASTKR